MSTLIVAPNPAPIGVTVSVSGSGYVAKARHRVLYSGSVKATFRTTRSGTFGPVGVVMPSVLVTANMSVQQYVGGAWKSVGSAVSVPTYIPLPAPGPIPDPTPIPELGFTDLPGWKLRVSTLFDGTYGPGQAPAGIAYYPANYRDTAEQRKPGSGCYYDPLRATIHDGELDMHIGYVDGVRKACAVVPQFRSPNIRVHWGGFRADRVTAMKVAPLTWPDDNIWPDGGEADHPETDLDGGDVDSFWHYAQKAGIEPHQDWFGWSGINLDRPHDYVIERRADQQYVAFGVDGVFKRTTRLVGTSSMHPVNQAETNLRGATIPDGTHGHVYMTSLAVWEGI